MKKNISFLLILLSLGSHLFAGPIMPWSRHRPEDESVDRLPHQPEVNHVGVVWLDRPMSPVPVMEPDLFKNGFRTGVCVVGGGTLLYGAGVIVASSLAERPVYMPHAFKFGATATAGYGLFNLFTDRRKWHWFGFTVPAALSMAAAFAGRYCYKQLQKSI